MQSHTNLTKNIDVRLQCDVMNQEKINLILLNNTAYVWNSKDWRKLRELKIVGNFIGNLAALPRQDQLKGLPLALLNVETTLLIEKGYAVLKALPNISNPPLDDVVQKSIQSRKNLLIEQSEILVNKRKCEIESKIDIILKGKKAKLNHSLNNEKSDLILTPDNVLKEELEKIIPPKESNLVVEIQTVDPWIQNEEYAEASWNFPNNNEQNLQYLVFKDLWEKGYYVTPGGKFGGDFLAYPGDPIKFHAFFIIICVDKTKKISMNEIIIYGRLGQSVRKTIVLASLNEDNQVEYQSVQWAGF